MATPEEFSVVIVATEEGENFTSTSSYQFPHGENMEKVIFLHLEDSTQNPPL